MRHYTGFLLVGCTVGALSLGFAGCGDDETGTTSSGGGGAGGATSTTTSTTTTTTTTSSGGGGGGGEVGGGGAGPLPSFADECPGGELAVLEHGTSFTVSGSTTNKPDNFSTFCGDTFAGNQEISDQVLELLVLQGCTLTLELTSDWNAVLGVRNEGLCLDEPPLQSTCINATSGSGTETLKRHMPSGRYHVIVDGAALEQAGDFTLDIECAAPSCGDGVLNPGEQCDNGPDVPNDGCSATCTVEAQVAGDSCAAPTIISIDAGQEAFWPSALPYYNNSTAGNDGQGTCGAPLGRDHVFAVTPTASGQLSVTVGQGFGKETLCQTQPSLNEFCWEHMIYVRTGDCETGAQLLCANMSYTTFATVAQFAVTAGTTYYVFVDGYINQPWAQGPYVMRLNHTPN